MGQMRLMGQDVNVRIIKDGTVQQYDAVTETEMTFLFTEVEVDLLGAKSTDYEMISRGAKVSLTGLLRTPVFKPLLETIKARAERTNPSARIDIAVGLNFPNGLTTQVIFIDLAFSDMGLSVGGRDSHVENKIEGSTGQYKVL